MSPITSISTWTKRLSLAQRSISATDFSTLCTGITIEPFLHQPVVQGAAKRIRHILGEDHLHAVQRVADAVADAERIQRLRPHVLKPRTRLALRRPPVLPRGDRRIGGVG